MVHFLAEVPSALPHLHLLVLQRKPGNAELPDAGEHYYRLFFFRVICSGIIFRFLLRIDRFEVEIVVAECANLIFSVHP